MAIPDLRTALDTLRDYLEDQLAEEPHATTFAAYGGVDVVLLDEEPTESERAGKPYIVLSGVDGENAAWGRGYRQATILAPTRASEYAGATYGVANPVPAQSLLSQALVDIVTDGRADLIDLGLEGSSINEGRETATQPTENQPNVVRGKDHTIICFYSRE